jgi:hypothetical protein
LAIAFGHLPRPSAWNASSFSLLLPALPWRWASIASSSGDVAPAVESSGDRSDLVQIEQTAERGLVHGVGDLLDGLNLSEIHDRPRDRRHGDAVPDSDVARVKAIAPMNAHAFDPHGSGCDHGDRRGTTPSDPPEVRRRAVIQCRTFSGSENRGEHAGLPRERGVPEGIDSAVNPVEHPAGAAPAHRAPVQPGRSEVHRSYEPVLPGGDASQFRVHRDTWGQRTSCQELC